MQQYVCNLTFGFWVISYCSHTRNIEHLAAPSAGTWGIEKSIMVLRAAIVSYRSRQTLEWSSFKLMFLQMNKRTVNVHSNRSARVLVRSATGRLVLSLVMANSCMPSSSATLACVRLFTSELRSSYRKAHRESFCQNCTQSRRRAQMNGRRHRKISK